VYDSLRAPVEAKVTDNALSEDSQARLDRAETWLAARGVTSEAAIDILRSTRSMGRMAIEDLALPAFTEEPDDTLELG